MTPLALALALLVPAILLVAYLRWKDRINPDPAWAAHVTVLGGAATGFAALYGYDLSRSLGAPDGPWSLTGPQQLFYLVGVAAPIEEAAKLLVVLSILFTTRVFDEMTDGLLYASTSAIGFATFENLYYVRILPFDQLIWRFPASPFAHIAFSCVWGYGIAKWRFRKGRFFFWVPLSFAVSCLMHGAYNYATLGGPPASFFASALILVGWLWILDRWHSENRRQAEALRRRDPNWMQINSTGFLSRRRRPRPDDGDR